jgi:hypothetical protein
MANKKSRTKKKQQKKHTKWTELEQALKKEPSLNSSRITASRLKQLYEDGMAAAAFDAGGSIIAFAVLWDTTIQWIRELGTIWVKKEYRSKLYCGKRLSQAILDRCFEILRKNSLNGVMLTQHKGLYEYAIANEWKSYGYNKHPLLRSILNSPSSKPVVITDVCHYKECWVLAVTHYHK